MFIGSISLLYVADPAASAEFYTPLLGQPVERHPTFVMYALEDGSRLGLWRRGDVVPAPNGNAGGAAEIGLQVAELADVDAVCARWQTLGAPITLPPADLDFGRSFVVTDPDGHRLRVYASTDPA